MSTKKTPKKTIKPTIKPKKDYYSIVTDSESDDSDLTNSSDSDYEGDSEEYDDPDFPLDKADMGNGVIISLQNSPWFSKDVTELTPDLLVELEKATAIVMFFAKWCPHCKDMKPEFEQVAKTSPIQCYALDCVQYPTISNKYSIYKYPTILFLTNGTVPSFLSKDDSHIYTGEPNKVELMEWIEKTKQKFLNYVPPNKISLPYMKGIKKLAYLKGVSDKDNFFSDSPNVTVLNPDSLDETIGKNKPFFIMFFATWCGHCINAKKTYIELSQKTPVYALDADKYTEITDKYNIQGFPTFAMMIPQKNTTIFEQYIGKLTVDDMLRFIKEKKAAFEAAFEAEAEVKADVKSLDDLSKEPEVKAEVKSLDDLSKEPEVIVMFYAPWCHHCTVFKPIFIALSKKNTIPFRFVNCDELPEAKSKYGITGFPTIQKLINGKTVSTFKGPRTPKTVNEWINQP